jgi:hypothetical protein
LMASPKMSAKELWWPIVMAHIAWTATTQRNQGSRFPVEFTKGVDLLNWVLPFPDRFNTSPTRCRALSATSLAVFSPSQGPKEPIDTSWNCVEINGAGSKFDFLKSSVCCSCATLARYIKIMGLSLRWLESTHVRHLEGEM